MGKAEGGRRKVEGGRRKAPHPRPLSPAGRGEGKTQDPDPETASGRVERELVARALERIKRGEVPAAQERRALERFERTEENRRRWAYYRSMPKAHYMALSGRSARVLIDQAERYGLPYPRQREATVDLERVLHWLHDFLAENAARLSGPQSDDPLLAGANSPALERYRLARAKREELELAAREGQLMDLDELLGWYDAEVAGPIRKGLEALRTQFGAAACELVSGGLGRAADAVERKRGLSPRRKRAEEGAG